MPRATRAASPPLILLGKLSFVICARIAHSCATWFARDADKATQEPRRLNVDIHDWNPVVGSIIGCVICRVGARAPPKATIVWV